jgi:DNA phosphorothioation-dependent restriction protein DptH
MNYYIETLFRGMAKQVQETSPAAGVRLQIMVPHLSGEDAVELLHRLSNLGHQSAWRLVFKVAEAYRQRWDAARVQDLEQKDCIANGNLTEYRNQILTNDPATLLVLVGTDLVTDKGGLADFYRCDGESAWLEFMNERFDSWIVPFFEQHGIAEPADGDVSYFNDILKGLRAKSDLESVSRLLGATNYGNFASAGDLVMEVLSKLGVFTLPNLSGFTRQLNRRPGFMYYIDSAVSFFNYDAFIEAPKRKKALSAIENFRQEGKVVPPEYYEPDFASQDDLLDALSEYIRKADRTSCDALSRCNFIYLYNAVLGFRPPTSATPDKKDTLRKLNGSPVEVVLQAIWETFEKQPFIDIGRIVLTGKVFSHDSPVEGNADELRAIALEELRRLIGGLDELCARHITLGLDAEDPGKIVQVESHLLNDDIAAKRAKTAEPYFEFSVKFEPGPAETGDANTFERRFAMRLPETHSHRLAIKLFARAREALASAAFSLPDSLPVFHLEYYKEFMLAREHEEVCRVMLHCLNAADFTAPFAENIFTPNWANHSSAAAMKPLLREVWHEYLHFLDRVDAEGLHAALELGGTPQLFEKYHAAATAFTRRHEGAKDSHPFAAMLMRSFLFIDKETRRTIDEWAVSPYEPSAAISVLHPALLEMLQSQIAFLFAAFSQAVATEFRGGGKFKSATWSYYVDLSEMKMPITGLCVDANNKFEVCSNGQGLFHRIGSITPDEALTATRFLTRYDEHMDDEEISEADLVRESTESRHLFRILKDYAKMHISANDGISLAVYRNDDIQPVLAAINHYVEWLDKERFGKGDRKEAYSVKVVFYSESSDASVVSKWLTKWQSVIDEIDGRNGGYGRCTFSVAYRVVNPDDEYRLFATTLREENDTDIFVLYNFIKTGSTGCEFRAADEFNSTQASLKFPILEIAQSSSTLPSERLKRSQVVSNRQFRISTDHAEMIARLRDANARQGQHHIILATGDYSSWQDVVDSMHETSEWVVCIDPSIDEALVGSSIAESKPRRELIGFASGVGLHGECNYTISTQKYFMDDIKRILMTSMRTVYERYGDAEHDQVISERLLQECKALSGISLIRALGPSEYVRDFMSYGLMHRILPLNDSHFLCNKLFSMDAYRHWFDQASEEDRTHPDLLWLQVSITSEGRIHIDATVIECKMAHEDQSHIEKAKAQIENGLKVLVEVFTPDQGGLGSMRRPDQRYWYLQLHRMIASSSNIQEEGRFLQALERLTAGDYEISWKAGVFAFWTDSLDAELKRSEMFDVSAGSITIGVPIFTAGYDFVYHVCASDDIQHLDWGLEVLQVPTMQAEPATQERPLEDRGAEEAGPDEVPCIESEEPARPDASAETVAMAPNSTVSAPSSSGVENRFETPCGRPGAEASPQAHSIPDRILLGRTNIGNREVYWEFGHPKLNNRHFLIFGDSGMGKTYAIQAILCELGRQQQNSLIVDYTGGFVKSQLQDITKEVLNPFQHTVKTSKLPINPFARQSQDLGDGEIIRDENIDVAKRVTSIFDAVYHLGTQQTSVLIDAIETGLNRSPAFSLDDLTGVLESFIGDEVHPKQPVLNTISKIKPFISTKPFEMASEVLGWGQLFSDIAQHCHVFQMAMMDRLSYLILTEFILWDFFSFARSSGNEKTPRVVVLDEVQNLNQNLEAPLGKILTEGRKFGIALIAATQTLNNLKSDEQARLFQAAHKLFFKPADTEVDQYSNLVKNAAKTGDKNEWKQRLISLSKGECLSIGPELNVSTGQLSIKVNTIRITSLEERGL